MMNQVYEKLAKVIVEYSLEVEKGNQVYIGAPTFATDFMQALNFEILKVGAIPLFNCSIEGIREQFYKHASDEQLEFITDFERVLYTKFDRLIEIRADYNTRKYSGTDPKKLAKFQAAPGRKELNEIFQKRSSQGEMKWIVVPYPCHAYAQEANMDLFSYFEFIKKSLHLDNENPVEEWRRMEKKQGKIISILNAVDNIQVLGEDTDIAFSVKGRKWINSCGKRNLPDGEIHTGPIEDSVNGHIRFSYPGIHMGKEIENIYLEFENGQVINATAQKGEDLLQEILKIENADRIGEFAIGTNYGVSKFTKNMLFDEKMGGTMHCALGFGFEESGSKNKSAIHWDILKDMKTPGSKILADNHVIYEEGKWKI